MKVTLTIEEGHAQAILRVLGKLPYEQVVECIDIIRAQVKEQQEIAAIMVAAPPAPE